MEKIVSTFVMCILSVCLYAQEKVQENKSLTTTSKQVADTSGQVVKPKYIDTGNPVEDQKRYEEAKAAYYKSVSEGSVSNNGVRTKEVIEKEIKQVESHINSINIKREHILKDPKATEEAEKAGWFRDMSATQERLEKKKATLEAELEKL